MTVSRSRANRPFKFGPNDRREFIVLNGEVTARLINDDGGNPIYVGRAKVGSSESEDVWQIMKLAYDANDGIVSITWPQNSDGISSTDYEFVYDDAATTAITGISQANPGVVTIASNPFTDGDIVTISAVVGMTEVNFDNTTSTAYIVANGTGTTFELTDLDGNNLDTSGFTAYSSGGTVKAPDALNYTFS